MVRRHHHNHDNSNAKGNGRYSAAAGLPLLSSVVSAERKIRLYSRYICLVDARCFGQPAFALCTFSRQQMASRGTRPQDLASGSNLEAFRHCFARFAACNGLRHMAGKLIRAGAMTNALLWCVCTSPECFRGFTEWNRRAAQRASSLAQADQTPYNFAGCNLPNGNSRG